MSTDWRNDPAWTAYVGAHPRDRKLALEHDGEQAVAAYKRTRPDIDTAAIIDKAVAAHYSKREIAPDKIVWEYGAAQARRVARDVAEAVVLAVLEDSPVCGRVQDDRFLPCPLPAGHDSLHLNRLKS